MVMKMITSFLRKIREFPEILMGKYPEMIEKLRMSDGQGTGNSPQPHESCFAFELEKHGFSLLKKGQLPTKTGAYYWYQPNGTQRSIDFVLNETIDGVSVNVSVDLKHSNGKTFYWNDGWFEPGVLYVISFKMKKMANVYIGYGELSCTPEETAAIQRRRELIRELNSDGGKVGHLRLYSRQANQYSCDKFTPEFCDERFSEVEQKLEPPE